MRLTVKNWSEFQHYKDRMPPWIKLHKSILDDRAFQRLPDASRALAPCIWLLASESKDGIFDGSVEEVAFRVRQTEKWVDAAIKPLISGGFLIVVQDASNALAECGQVAVPETETETYKPKPKESAFALPEWVPLEAWKGFVEMRTKSKSAFTERAKALLVGELFALVEAGGNAARILDQSTANGWKGVFPLKANGGNGKTQGAPWWSSNEGITAKAAELHVESRKGESWNDLKARVSAEMEAHA